MEQKSTSKLAHGLKKKSQSQKKAIWQTVSRELSTPRRRHVGVNVGKIARLAERFKDDQFVVMGSVLGSGVIAVPVTVFAFSFSQTASEKIASAKGHAHPMAELLKVASVKHLRLVK